MSIRHKCPYFFTFVTKLTFFGWTDRWTAKGKFKIPISVHCITPNIFSQLHLYTIPRQFTKTKITVSVLDTKLIPNTNVHYYMILGIHWISSKLGDTCFIFDQLYNSIYFTLNSATKWLLSVCRTMRNLIFSLWSL